MAEIVVTKDKLERTIAVLDEHLSFLKEAVSKMESLLPEGFTIGKGPPVNDSYPAIIEFAALIHSRIRVAELEADFGQSSKNRRKELRESK